MEDKRQWPLYEVFIRARGGLDHKHVGSLHAADARMALDHARDLYTRRQEGVSIWVVPSAVITGTVLDPSGLPLPKARVTAKSLETALATSRETAADGTFRLAGLPPGERAAQGLERFGTLFMPEVVRVPR